MNQYRLHIDIPLGTDEEQAKKIARNFVQSHLDFTNTSSDGVKEVNYRLGHDEDRQRSNYLDINENGHCSNKKLRITYA
jgi:hypothetical protein